MCAAARRLPQIGTQLMTRDAGDTGDGRHPLRGDRAPAGYGAALNAQLTGNLGTHPLVGGIAQQVHAETCSHSVTLREAKLAGKPLISLPAQNLFRDTKPRSWHTFPMTIGARIRVARLGLGLTQRYVAKALGVNPSAVNQWESGTTKPSITKRAELAVLLNLRLDELIPEAPVNEISDTIARIIRGLPPHKQAALVVAIEGLARLIDDPPPNTPTSPRAKENQNS
jgi:transcriptional regulator with XRE-family HTH domain